MTAPLSLSCLRCNALQTNDPYYFKSCTYDPSLSPSCPIFRVRDMVEAAGETFGDLALLVLVLFNVEDDSRSPRDVGKGQGSGLTRELLRECVICGCWNSEELVKSPIPNEIVGAMCSAGREHRSSH